MPHAIIAACTIILSAFTLDAVTQHADAAPTKGTSSEAQVPDEDGCFKKVGIKGRPHKLHTVASLSAVRRWSEAARKHGDQYAMWHNAANSSIKCHKLPNSDYHACFASGKPCPTTESRKQANKN